MHNICAVIREILENYAKKRQICKKICQKICMKICTKICTKIWDNIRQIRLGTYLYLFVLVPRLICLISRKYALWTLLMTGSRLSHSESLATLS